MRRALAQAERGLGRTTPNPVVGCTIVSPDGVVVGDGAHERAGGPHAEINALKEAGSRARGATLYCTLEPCVHTGRTGPCTERIIAAGIARVVAAIEDPDPRVSGRGFAMLRDSGIDVTVGVEAEEAERLNRAYLMFTRRGRPWVIVKAAMSADGCVAAGEGVRSVITDGPAARHAHMMRAQVDALAVGSGTLLIDDPLLTAREVFRVRPLTRVVFDRRLRTPASARVFSTCAAGPVIILTSTQAAAAQPLRVQELGMAGGRVIPLDAPTILEGMKALAALDVQSLIVEGGPLLHRAVLDAGVVDQVHLYVAPAVIGRSGVAWLAGKSVSSLTSLTARALGRDVFLEGYVHRSH